MQRGRQPEKTNLDTRNRTSVSNGSAGKFTSVSPSRTLDVRNQRATGAPGAGDLRSSADNEGLVHTSIQKEQDRKAFKDKERQYLEDRAQSMKRLEHLKREYSFIERLDNRDVDYILTRKKEQAAIVLQRNFRARKARTEAKRTKLSNIRPDQIVWDQNQLGFIRQKKDDLDAKLLKLSENQNVADNFTREITRDRQDDLFKQLVGRRAIKTDQEIFHQADLSEKEERYQKSYKNWLDCYQESEESRLRCEKQIEEIRLMSSYMTEIDDRTLDNIKRNEQRILTLKTESVIGKARSDGLEKEGAAQEASAELAKKEYEHAEEQAFLDARNRLRRLAPGWSEIAPPETYENDSYVVKRNHKEKMKLMRAGKDWAALVAEDDVDIYAEQILAEIKNYKEETMYESRFYQ